jgi:hypothetical protein
LNDRILGNQDRDEIASAERIIGSWDLLCENPKRRWSSVSSARREYSASSSLRFQESLSRELEEITEPTLKIWVADAPVKDSWGKGLPLLMNVWSPWQIATLPERLVAAIHSALQVYGDIRSVELLVNRFYDSILVVPWVRGKALGTLGWRIPLVALARSSDIGTFTVQHSLALPLPEEVTNDHDFDVWRNDDVPLFFRFRKLVGDGVYLSLKMSGLIAYCTETESTLSGNLRIVQEVSTALLSLGLDVVGVVDEMGRDGRVEEPEDVAVLIRLKEEVNAIADIARLELDQLLRPNSLDVLNTGLNAALLLSYHYAEVELNELTQSS